MIRETCKADKQDVYTLWKQAYPNQNRNYLNFYFKYIFDKGTCIVMEQDDRIISSLQMNEHILRFQGKQLKISYLLGVSTLPDYRRRGNMKQLMKCALDEASHNHLITLIEAFNPKLYEQFGFVTMYYHKFYTIHKETFLKISTAKISYNAQAHELLQAYQNFTTHFDGYYVRDVAYYQLLLNELVVHQKQMVVYRNRNREVSGYLIFHNRKDEVMVEEAIYTESIALLRMLKAALGNAEEITVAVSQNEMLEKLFPMVIAKKQPAIMAKIHNIELFNKLYNMEIKHTKDAFVCVKRPLWCHEYY